MRDQDALELGLALQFFDPRGDGVEGVADFGRAVEVEHDAADIGLVQDFRADDLGDDGKADFPGDRSGLAGGLRDFFLGDGNAVGP